MKIVTSIDVCQWPLSVNVGSDSAVIERHTDVQKGYR